MDNIDLKQLEFGELTENVLRELYCKYHLRCKEIGQIFGLTESGVDFRRKKLKIPTLPRTAKRSDVRVSCTGNRNLHRKDLTDEILRERCLRGDTDAHIGKDYGYTGENIAILRKVIGIEKSDKYNPLEVAKKALYATSKETLKKDSMRLTNKEFSLKYGVSKMIWRPYLRSLAINTKFERRHASFPSLTKDQITVIIGGLLGDGSVSGQTYYYETHKNGQKQYLKSKARVLAPYSGEVKPDAKDCCRFQTIHHNCFREFYAAFYVPGSPGKRIPLDFLKEHWDDRILAYWYLDEGSLDDEDNTFSICNKCPEKEQLTVFCEFLSDHFGWDFRYNFYADIHSVHLAKKDHEEFFRLVKRVATPDMYYKIPEKFLTSEEVKAINISEFKDFKTKFYRLPRRSDDPKLIL